MKNYNSDANNKDVITVDYMVTGGRQKDCILTSKNHLGVFNILSPVSDFPICDVVRYTNLCNGLQSGGSWQKWGNL